MSKLSKQFRYFVLGVMAVRSHADSCCGGSHCTDSCPWNNACDDGKDMDCKDDISGPFRCRNRSVCYDYDDCSDEDAGLRAGHLCDGFPHYNGGYPIDTVKHDDEHEEYGCEAVSTNGMYCAKWFTLENGLDEFEDGEATCETESSSGEYCQAWSIEQEEYKKCWTYTYYADDDGGEKVGIACCTDNPGNSCCGAKLCPKGFYDAYPVQYEYADCFCLTEARDGSHCVDWFCNEYNARQKDWKNGAEFEYYTCHETKTVTVGGKTSTYCVDWKGNIDSREEFELSKCGCTEDSTSSPICESWSCEEMGFDYWWPNVLWTLFSAIFALPVSVTALYFLHQVHVSSHNGFRDLMMVFGVYFVAVVIWVGGFTMIGVWKAGLGVFFMSFFPTQGPPILAFLWKFYLAYQVFHTNSSEGYTNKSTTDNNSSASINDTRKSGYPGSGALNDEGFHGDGPMHHFYEYPKDQTLPKQDGIFRVQGYSATHSAPDFCTNFRVISGKDSDGMKVCACNGHEKYAIVRSESIEFGDFSGVAASTANASLQYGADYSSIPSAPPAVAEHLPVASATTIPGGAGRVAEMHEGAQQVDREEEQVMKGNRDKREQTAEEQEHVHTELRKLKTLMEDRLITSEYYENRVRELLERL